jgi:lysophospholipase L1-like esterase
MKYTRLGSIKTCNPACRKRSSFIIVALASLIALPCLPQTSSVAAPINSAAADFAALSHYRAADVAIHDSGAPVKVVFLGDSITEYWGSRSGTWFKEKGWLNRGIGGQTTSQLLLRVRPDVIALHPQAIVIEGGSNDMRMGFSPETIRDNIASIGELAQDHGIAVFVASMTPVCDCFKPLSGLRTVNEISRLNLLLRQLCMKEHWNFINLNPTLADPSGHMRSDLTVDGVHPNAAGYRILGALIAAQLNTFQ